MIRALLAAGTCALVAGLPLSALAEIRPKPGARDSRITAAQYSEGQVYHVSTRLLNSTLIELDPGEKIFNVAAGDSESFQISEMENPNVFTIKPQVAGAETNLIVETSKRFYLLRVTEGQGTPNWLVRINGGGGSKAGRSAPAVRELPGTPPKKMRYAVAQGSAGAGFAPVGVSDDGRKTYLQIPPDAPMPAVFRADAKGRETSVNSSTKGNVIVVSGRSERWVLRHGDDYVCITGR
ncbi:TrbG/VirB9 family P-type conjugative transfer protein [Paracoccus laeviglucosivorans]|uniref:Type IV secretion system protein VirB9 n=1 Tax=Paracoccus laeviglucosivorans TaxID=1197861 RepID=A0A521FSG3_9RHOB|nr:TrbG/VirB9 family P-type conjugative transfer protein [Paracoccus laeviglucosivorans]SMO99165.1 type IV secretion system protein VirB9 [Paracoccus laeviglucosivorans]